MSNNLPTFSQSDSNNSGLNASTSRFHSFSARVVDISYRFHQPTFNVEPHMNTQTAPGDSVAPDTFTGELSTSTLIPTEVGDPGPSSPSSGTEVTGATIEVITVEKYKRSDGFANPYHIQGLNASTPDDVDDEDDEDEEEGDANASIDENLEDTERLLDVDPILDEMAHEGDDGDEGTVKKSHDDIEPSVNSAFTKDHKTKQPSIPTSTESTVSSESHASNASSTILPVPPPSIAPRSDSISSGVSQPQRLFQFTVERVPSTESNGDPAPIADQQTAHITPPVSVSRAPTSESLFIPEVPSDTVSVDESVINEPITSAEVPPSGGAPWMPPDFQATSTGTADLTSPLPQWASAEMAAAAAATAAVASAVVNPVVAPHTSQAMNIGQTTGPHFGLAVAAASAAVAAMNNMMIDPNLAPSSVPHDLSAFAPKPSMMGADLSGIAAYISQSTDDSSCPVPAKTHSKRVSGADRGSTPSPGPPTQSNQLTPPQPSNVPVESVRPHPVGAEDAPVERENDEGEIRFRRARYLEKRERWHDKRFLVVDTFRREEPLTRTDVSLPDPTLPSNCARCVTRLQKQPVKARLCPCSNHDPSVLKQKIERHRYPHHAGSNHGYVAGRNKHAVEDYFGYPETVAIMERASQLVSGLAATMHPSRSSADFTTSAKAVGTVAAAAVASMSKTGGRETNMSCSSPSANPSMQQAITLRRNRLQRNNSHFQIARSSPSSFNANEFPRLDKVAAMAAAAVVSVTAAMRDRGMHSERSSETEVDQPLNPPTSPASGLTRDSMNRSSSQSEVASDGAATLKPSIDNRNTSTISSVRDAASEHSSPPVERQQHSSALPPASASKTAAISAANQSNTHMAEVLPSSTADQTTGSTQAAAQASTVKNVQRPQESAVVQPQVDAHNDSVKTGGGYTAASQGPAPVHPTSQTGHQPVQDGQQAKSKLQQSASQAGTVQKQKTITQVRVPDPKQAQQSQPQDSQHQSQHSQQQPTQHSMPPSQPSSQKSQHIQPQQQQQQQKPPQAQGAQPNPPGASSSSMASSISSNANYSVSQPTVSGAINPTETAVAAAYAACGLMMQGGYGGLSVLGEHSVLPTAPTNVSSNTSSMNYLEQYHHMQPLLPVGPTATTSTAPDAVRQNTEARIAQSLDTVRLAMVSYFRELEEKHTYQVKSLQEEVRQLREQRERDHALIREYVPPECLVQLGHPYTSLANMPPQGAPTQGSTVSSASISGTTVPAPTQPVQTVPQSVGEHGVSGSASQPPVNSAPSTQPPSQQPE